ncbi:MAG: hypothetical protein ACKOET_03355 [Verrucomicrobiota bacterium]
MAKCLASCKAEHARPAWDYFELWRDANWAFADPPARVPVKGQGIYEPLSLQVRDTNGLPWNVGLAAVKPLVPLGLTVRSPRPAEREVGGAFRTNLLAAVKDQELELAVMVASPNRTAVAFVYAGPELLQQRLLAEGWVRLEPAEARLLPLREQYALRLAERTARREKRGGWAEELRPPAGPPR